MNILASLMKNESIKEAILNKFIASFRAQGITQILIEIKPNDEITILPLSDTLIVTDKAELIFLKDFFSTHFKI